MRPVAVGLILTFLVLGILGPLTSLAGDPAAERAKVLQLSQKARYSLAFMDKKTRQVLAFCDLAAKAALIFPRLARDYYQKALSAAQDQGSREYLVLAARLKSAAAQSARALSLSRDLEERALAAWPLRLVAEGALPLDPGLAGRALQMALQRCRKNPYPGRRGLDMAGLCLVLARRDRQKARLLAAQITNPRVRSWTYRELARLTQAEPDLEEALRAAGQIKDPGARAISLAQTAGLYYQVRQKAGADLFKRAFKTAGQVEDRQRRFFVQGEVAAAAASCNASLAAQMADQVDAVNGACFKVWRRAWASMAGAASADRELLLAKAKNQARSLPSDYEQNQALSLLASDLAVLDMSAAEEMKKALPRSMYYLRGEAETAMVLAEAGRDLNRAVSMAAGIEDQACRILVSARLAAILVKRDAPRGLAFCQKVLQGADGPVGDLARAILAPALVVSDPKLAISEAARIADPSIRVKTLLRVAVRLAKNGGRPGAEQALELALETINSGKIKQTLDKARLLGHMGREWFELEADRARGFFAAGAKFAAESR